MPLRPCVRVLVARIRIARHALDYKPPRFLQRRARLAARDRRGARPRSSRRPRTRRPSIAAAPSWRRASRRSAARVTRLARAERGDHICWRNSACGGAADPAARSLRYGLAGRPARAHAADADGRPPARPGRLRHEGRHRASRCSRCARSSRPRPRSSHRIVMLWTTDEEIGSGTSRAAIEEEARAERARCWCSSRRCPAARVKTSRKGCGELSSSRSAASPRTPGIEPEKGASAVHELAHQILAHQRAPGSRARASRVNVGPGVAAGSRSNVIPDEARAIVDVRVPTADAAAEVDAAFRGLRPVDARTHDRGARRLRSAAARTQRQGGASVQ